jgi:type I restriction enzyme, S subunit
MQSKYPVDPQIPIPPRGTQKRIADVLDKAQELIDQRKAQIAKLDQFLVSSFMRIVGPMAEDYQLWKLHEISELTLSGTNRVRTGPSGSNLLDSEFVSDGICVLGIDNAVLNRFGWRKRRFITAEKYEKLRRYTVYPEDVIITIMGTIGRSAVVPKEIPTAISTKHLAVFTLNKEKANPYFISFCVHSHPFVLQQLSLKNSGAIMDGLNLGKIKSLRIPLPPLDSQNKFAQIWESTALQKELMQRNLAEMETNFNSLIQRAFQGELF